MKKSMSIENMLGGCITDMLFYVNQLHLTHWLTLKNHHHVVVGELYEELESELDELAEQFLGACLPEMKPEEALNLSEGVKEARYYKVIKSEADILALVDEITRRAQKGLGLVEDNPKYSFMRDSIMDIIAVLHSAKYQITQE
jgi:DNA-binding ferritin-like protein